MEHSYFVCVHSHGYVVCVCTFSRLLRVCTFSCICNNWYNILNKLSLHFIPLSHSV